MRRKLDLNAQRQIWIPSRPNKRSREEIAKIDGELPNRANRIGGGHQPMDENIEDNPQNEETEENEPESEGESQIIRGDNFPHFINISTNPEGCHMSNYIRQNEVNTADEPLKVEKPLLESSSEIDKLVYEEYQIFPRHQNYRDGDKLSCSRILSDGEFQLTEPWSVKILVEEARKYIGFHTLREKFS